MLEETLSERTPAEWHEPALAAGVIAHEKALRRQQERQDGQEIARLRAELEVIKSSTSWRLALPAQALIAKTRKLRTLVFHARR